MKQIHLNGAETQLERLSKLGDPLEKINKKINWEIFRRPIEEAIRKDMSKGGSPPFSCSSYVQNNNVATMVWLSGYGR